MGVYTQFIHSGFTRFGGGHIVAYSRQRINLTMYFRDEDDQITTKVVDLVAGATDADTFTNAADVVAAYAALTTAALDEYNVVFKYEDGSLVAGGDSEVQARANVVLDLVTDANHKQEFGVLEIPSPVDSLFLASSGEGKNIVDITDAALLTLVGLYSSGAGQAAYIGDRQAAETVDPVIRGKRFHRGSRKG